MTPQYKIYHGSSGLNWFKFIGLHPLYFDIFSNTEALLRVLGNMGKGHLFKGNKGQMVRGTREQRQYWGTGKTNFQILGNKPIYFRGTREQVPPPPGRDYTY